MSSLPRTSLVVAIVVLLGVGGAVAAARVSVVVKTTQNKALNTTILVDQNG